jgi:hypothetical protein
MDIQIIKPVPLGSGCNPAATTARRERISKLPCFTKPKNRDGYYFTPTVDGKTKWVPLGTDKQAVLEKYHLDFLVFLPMMSLRSENVQCQQHMVNCHRRPYTLHLSSPTQSPSNHHLVPKRLRVRKPPLRRSYSHGSLQELQWGRRDLNHLPWQC